MSPIATSTMKQERAPTGKTFWDLSEFNWRESVIASAGAKPSVKFVSWRNRTWLRKSPDESSRSICEIAGYQIAQAIGLPIQPWVAFLDRLIETPRIGTGLLIERWDDCFRTADLDECLSIHPKIACRALAFATLDRFEWPQLMVNIDGSEVRAFDFEFIGPKVFWPVDQKSIADYGSETQSAFREAYRCAADAQLTGLFLEQLNVILKLKFEKILDFSGHPEHRHLRALFLKGFGSRRAELRRCLPSIS